MIRSTAGCEIPRARGRKAGATAPNVAQPPRSLMAAIHHRQHQRTAEHPPRDRPRYDVSVDKSPAIDAIISSRDLRGRLLAGSDFSGHDLRLADLVAANLEGSILTGSILAGAKLHNSRLRHATLTDANLSGAAIRDADFEGANLRGVDLQGADLRGSVLLEADLRDADLRGANLSNTDLRGADLTGARIDGANFDGADLARAHITGASPAGISAKYARIQGTTGDLVEALNAAGAIARPPLRIGRLAAVIGLAAVALASLFQRGLRLVSRRLQPAASAFSPFLQRLEPLASAVSRGPKQLLASLRALPRHAQAVVVAIARRIGAEAMRSGDLAASVRTQAQERLQKAAAERTARAEARVIKQRATREAQAQRLQDALPGGPGADLRGQNFRGARLAFVLWAETQLQEANLRGAVLDKADLRKANLNAANLSGARLRETDLRGASLRQADLEGARIRGGLLTGVNAQEVNLTDADLRSADLRNIDLSGSDLSGADLRGAQLSGACLRNVNLTGARLPDVDLVDALIDGAVFDQADVAGVQWASTSATGADLSGALGLGTRDRELLRLAGATVDDIHLERLLGRLGARPVQIGMAVLGLGMAAYLAARFMGSDVINPAQLEVQAQSLRESDPAQASARYVDLASVARRVEDQVGYLVEAALLAETAGDPDDAEGLLNDALDAAEAKPSLAAETRLRLATFHHTQQRWADSLEVVTSLIQEVDQPTEQRARAIVLFDNNRAALGLTGESPRDTVFSSMGDLPETQAALHLALAELYTNNGDTSQAITEVQTAEGLEVPSDIRLRLLEARARILDRAGDIEQAIATWKTVLEQAEDGSISSQAAPLAIADLHLRLGRTDKAARQIKRVLDMGADNRIRGRALLVSARISEQRDQPSQAIEAYREVLNMPELDVETLDEARISMASLVLSDKGSAQARTLLDDLAPDALTEVLAHAKLGEARRLLDSGNAAGAHPIFADLVASAGLPSVVRRASRSGLGEALAQMGELYDALDIWRELLAEPGTSHDRVQLELLVANGLLQGGRRKEASTAFRSLADSENSEAQVQGLLGLAEVARAAEERERARSLYRQVADQQVDPVWKVRALQELADMKAESRDSEGVVQITRELLGALPPGHISAPEARLSLISALLQSSEFSEASRLCESALSAAPSQTTLQAARVACAEVDERAGNPEQAMNTYRAVLGDEAPADVLTDAALGLARSAFVLDRPEAIVAPLVKILTQTKAPALRLPLLSMQVRVYRALESPVDLAAASAERDAIAEQIPEIAWLSFIEAASQSRSAGDPDNAMALLERAMSLPISNAERAAIGVEMGGALLDLGELDLARQRFDQAIQFADSDDPISFYAGVGMADIERRLGHPRLALEWLEGLTPPDRAEHHSWMAARAAVLTEMGDPRSEAAWAELAGKADTDLETRYTAIKGQADALLAEDRPLEAIPLFEQARTMAQEEWQAGWAAIGLASAYIESEDIEAAITLLDDLRAHADEEVRMEATLRRSRIASDQQDWPMALRALNPRTAISLGPAWDASATDARTRALMGAGDTEGAAAAWRALAARWPEDEEATLPAWLGLAQMALDRGEHADAHHWARKAFKEARDPGYKLQAKSMVEALDE